MIYKEKVLILHRNSILQERISAYLRENSFAVIMANNIENAYNLAKSMRPDIILWGETLTAQSKEMIRKIKKSRYGSTIPIIAMIPDVELFDRIEIENIGINDIIDTLPSFTDLKVKIRFHLSNRRRIRQYEEEIHRLQDISTLQYNMIRVQDLTRMCELVNDYIYNLYQPDALVSLVYNKKSREYEFAGLLSSEPRIQENKDSIFRMPLWQKYFFSNPKLETERVADSYLLKFFTTIGLNSKIYYQFPLKVNGSQIGLIILGLNRSVELPETEIKEMEILTGSLAQRILNIRSAYSGKPPMREDTAEIQYLFQRLNEDEISDYLCQQMLNLLDADVSIYLNYNEGFRFLYPQYCYKSGSDQNLFEDEKPPVLLLKDFPNFEDFIESNKAAAHFDLSEMIAPDLKKIAGLGYGEYSSLLVFSIRVGNEIKGFLVVANENSMKRFTNAEIHQAEQNIQKATNVMVESRLVRQAQKTIKQLDRVFELGKELTLEIEINDLLKKIASAIRRTLGWNIVILDKHNMYNHKDENVCVFGMKYSEYQALQAKFSGSMLYNLRERCFQISNSYFYDHELADEKVDDADQRRFLLSIGKEWSDSDWLFVPIQSRGRELGYIAVNDPVERIRPTEGKVRSLEYFANQAAVALENAALYQNLKSSEHKYRLLAETMTMGLVTCDFNGKMLYVNKSLAHMLKYKKSDSLATQSLFNLCSAKTSGELEKYVLQMVKENKPGSGDNFSALEVIEIELLANDNQYIPFNIYLTPYYEHARKAGFIGVLADLRPQRRLERLKSDFNSMIVHDLRSPLNIIQGYIDIVRNQVVGKISKEQSELLFIAKDNVDKVLKLIDNFMIASKLEAGKFTLNYEIHSVNALVEAVYEHQLILARNKELNLSTKLDHNISLQQFDKLRIEQVLSNYLSNAIKFTKRGGSIEIFTKLVKERNELTGDETMAAHVAVKDSGVGIPYKEQKKVFSKYEQTEAGKDASLKGTGLGLAICKEIISLHEGKVWVESEPGKGSTFYFSLPINPLKI